MEYRWVPGHHEVLGNELADQLAKKAAERHPNAGSGTREILGTASLAHVARSVTEAKLADRKAWLVKHCVPTKYYKCRRKADPIAVKTRKALASRFYQLRVGKAPTGPYLHQTGRRPDDKCWWCNLSSIKTRDHLFKSCKRWKNEQRVLWKAVNEATKEGRQAVADNDHCRAAGR